MKKTAKETNEIIEVTEEIISSFLKNNFGITWDGNVSINNRLKSTLGYYYHPLDGSKAKIEISGKFLTGAYNKAYLLIVLHEALHHALYSIDVNNSDKHHTFEYTLKFFGVCSNQVYQDENVRYCRGIFNYNVYKCPKCGDEYYRSATNKVPNKSSFIKTYHSKCYSDIKWHEYDKMYHFDKVKNGVKYYEHVVECDESFEEEREGYMKMLDKYFERGME